MIRKTKEGFEVMAESGRVMSKPNLTRKAALKRLRQIEYFKNKGKK